MSAPDPSVATLAPLGGDEIHPEDYFPGLAGMLEDFLSPQIELAPDPFQPDSYLGLVVERLHIELPIELQLLRASSGEAFIGATPPSQWIETSVEPVLHRVALTLELDPEPGDDHSRDQTLES